MVMTQYQDEGRLRPDILLGGRRPDQFPFMWLLTHDSKADFFTRGLYVMKPWYKSRPKQLGQARVLAVMDPAAVSRAWALQLMCDAPSNAPPPKPQAPAWVQKSSKTLARFWGDGLDAAKPLTVNEPIFQWAQQYPQMLRETADEIVQKAKSGVIPNAADSTISQNARALLTIISRYDQPGQGRAFSRILLGSRPEGLTEAVEILIKHREKLRQIYLRSGYTDPEWIGGPVDGP
jgi:hypothetical protein